MKLCIEVISILKNILKINRLFPQLFKIYFSSSFKLFQNILVHMFTQELLVTNEIHWWEVRNIFSSGVWIKDMKSVGSRLTITTEGTWAPLPSELCIQAHEQLGLSFCTNNGILQPLMLGAVPGFPQAIPHRNCRGEDFSTKICENCSSHLSLDFLCCVQKCR